MSEPGGTTCQIPTTVSMFVKSCFRTTPARARSRIASLMA
jgi:hypothetical protein